jgi:hypothetical protein
MFDLANFTLRDMTECGAALRRLGAAGRSMEEVAQLMVRHLYEHLTAPGGAPACALVRFFKTHPYAGLDAGARAFADRLLGGRPAEPGLTCLALLASAGAEPQWNSRHTSAGHQAIPLPSEEVVTRLPMIAQLLRQFGLEIATVTRPDPALLGDREQRTCNVFHVAEAAGSPYVPAQDFVRRHGVRSVFGFGGVLPAGDLFAVILFARVAVPADTAELFKALALSARLAVLPFARGPVFAAAGPGGEVVP